MANLEIEGRITHKLDVQSGQSARGPWARQDFVVEFMDGNFPSSVCFSAWGQDKVQELGRFQTGDSVRVSFNVRGREYNGKWYNDLRVWRISPAGQEPAGAQPYGSALAPEYRRQDAPAAVAPAPTMDDLPADFGDDLPF